jgi:hypothetical protein
MRATRSGTRPQPALQRLRGQRGRGFARLRLGVLALVWLLGVALPRATIAQEAAPRLHEVVVTVASLAPLQEVFTEVLRWNVIFRGDVRNGEAAGWGLPPGSRGRQLLIGSAGANYGHIRFIELAAARSRSTYSSVTPQRCSTACARGRFARMIGPHDLVLSFQERQAPPLDEWPRFTGASHVENVMEPLGSLDASTRITGSLLGVAAPPPTVRDLSARPEAAATCGLPTELATQAGARQSILRIGRSKEQMLTAWQSDSLRGEDYASQVNVHHLGVLALRVRIPDVDASMRRMRPYGAIRSVVVRSGGGSGLLLEALPFAATPIR